MFFPGDMQYIPLTTDGPILSMYDAYHALGGNGMITKMKHEIEELRLKKKEGNSHEKN